MTDFHDQPTEIQPSIQFPAEPSTGDEWDFPQAREQEPTPKPCRPDTSRYRQRTTYILLASSLICCLVPVVFLLPDGWFARGTQHVVEKPELDETELAPTKEKAPKELTGKCVSITDGDTLVVLVDKTQHKIRLLNIDAPEDKQPFSKQAKEHLASLVFEKTIYIECSSKDRYGRVLGTVFENGVNVNREMVKAGFAWNYVKYSKDKDLPGIEAEAREAKRGLWADPNPIPPWEWRKGKRPEKDD